MWFLSSSVFMTTYTFYTIISFCVTFLFPFIPCFLHSFLLLPISWTRSVTVSLGSISNLTCQHLSVLRSSCPLSSSQPPLHAFSLCFSSLCFRLVLPLAVFSLCVSLALPSRLVLLPKGRWLTSSNLKCKVWCHRLCPRDLCTIQTHC